MHIISISLDPEILDPQSRVSARNLLYGAAVSSYRVFVHHHKDTISERQHNVTVYGIGGSTKFIRLFRMLARLQHFIRFGSCDVISCSDPYFIGLGVWFLASINKVGFEVNILGIEKQTSIRKLLARFVIRHAGSVRVNSMHLRQYIADTFGLPITDILFVPTPYVPRRTGLRGSKEAALQEAMFQQYREQYKQFFNLLCVGRLVPVNDHAMQIKALATLISEGEIVHLHIVGEGPLRGQLEVLVQELNLANFVTFHGVLNEPSLAALYSIADAYLLTSKFAGWPMSIFDAIAAHTPIIMTEVGCAGELIRDHEQGLVIQVGDIQALIEAVRSLVRDTSLRARLTEAAFASFQNYWSLDKILAGYKHSWERAAGAVRH